MSITISFSMRQKKHRRHGRERMGLRLQELAKSLGKELGYSCDVVRDLIVCQFCPEGFVWMGWHDGWLVGDCQTNIAGPGFHVAVIHFLELFVSKADMKLFIQDDTGYYKERDFVKMRRNYFYRWYTGLMERVLEKQHEGGQLIGWPADYYQPEVSADTVITHIRPFTYNEISGIVNSGISMAFAKDFFIWNEEQKDAYYYRNCALVMLNQECHFMPSSRHAEDYAINQRIIGCLERALELDPRIPFPKKEYLELCRLAGHEPVSTQEASEYAPDITIGCRRGLVFRTIGCVRFAVPGNFLYDASWRGHSEHYYDGSGSDAHDYYIFAFQTENLTAFQEISFENARVDSIHDFKAGGARGKMAVYLPQEKDGIVIYSVAAQIIYKNQITIISISYENTEDRGWAMDLIQKVQTID